MEVDLKLLSAGLVEWREQLRTEVGTELRCPFCKRPRVRRSDYIRCNPCATNWLDEERGLRDYLNRDPGAARAEGRRGAISLVTADSSGRTGGGATSAG
jgi:hypothetical protein